MKYKILLVILVLAIVIGSYFIFKNPAEAPIIDEPTPIATVGYVCNNKATVVASYFAGEATSTPGGRVEVTLSDGRTLSLAQTISASGIRYSNGDPQIDGSETFVFWSKGDGALVLENSEEKSYLGCVATAPVSAGLTNIYHDGQNGFTIRYPDGWTIDRGYQNPYTSASLPNFHDLKFVISPTSTIGTNLSSNDTGLSIEMLPSETCSAAAFTDQRVTVSTSTIHDVEYSVATTSGAGAGNFYEEYIFARPYSRPCLAVRYLIHSTNISNYEPGTITAFDRTALLTQLDTIRDSLRLAQ